MKRKKNESFEAYRLRRKIAKADDKLRQQGRFVWISMQIYQPEKLNKDGSIVLGVMPGTWYKRPVMGTLVLKNVPDAAFIKGCPKKARYLKVA